jgi:hypothetical protein
MMFTSCSPTQTLAFGRTQCATIEEVEDDEGAVLLNERQAPKKKGIPEVVIQKKGPPKSALKTVTDAAPDPKAIQKLQPTTVDGKFPPPPPMFKYQAAIKNPLLMKSVIQ